MSPPSSATARRRCAERGLALVRLAVGRDRRHAGLAALRQGAGAARRCPSSTCRPRRSRARATSSRRRWPGPEIGVASTKAFTCQLAVLACLAIGGRPRARRAVGRGRSALSRGADRGAAPDGRGAEARGADRGAGARPRQGAGRALSRPRHQLSAGAGRRAEAQGNLLHPRRGLCGRRAEARPDRADRRDDAGRRDRAA